MPLMKPSCFSAVTPVSGWNQWVKCVAPCSSAQFFMASAMSLAASSGSGFSCFRHSRQTSMASCGTYCSMVRSLNTIEPNSSGIRSFALILVSPLSENVVDTFFI